MNPASRRTFLTLAGAGAATVAVATVSSTAPAAAKPVAAAKPTALPAGAQGALVAHVKDVKRGIVTVMAAGHSVDITDHELVARMAHAAASASTTKA